MARNHKPEDIMGKLPEAEIVLAQGGTVTDACRWTGVTEQSYYRWRNEYRGLSTRLQWVFVRCDFSPSTKKKHFQKSAA